MSARKPELGDGIPSARWSALRFPQPLGGGTLGAWRREAAFFENLLRTIEQMTISRV
jgi:hypothetical protein